MLPGKQGITMPAKEHISGLFHVVSMETHYGTLSHIAHLTATMKPANHGNKA
jgi:hypothetical protein